MKIKVIVNPNAGKRTAQKELERILGRLLLEGTAESVSVYRTHQRNDATACAAALLPGQYDLVIACGGDGTINEVLNGLMQGGSHTPMAILAAGTSNDFAFSLSLPGDADGFCRMVQQGNCEWVDAGRANGRHFINVASFGMFTGVAHSTDQEQKNLLGKVAYYLQALKNAPAELNTSFPLTIRSEEFSGEGDYHLCLVSNSSSVGSFRRLMNRAEVTDGLFDVLLLKRKKLLELEPRQLAPAELLESLRNGPNKNPLFSYFQTRHIEFDSPEAFRITTDLDGEAFGSLPLTVDVVHHAVQLLMPGLPPVE